MTKQKKIKKGIGKDHPYPKCSDCGKCVYCGCECECCGNHEGAWHSKSKKEKEELPPKSGGGESK